MLFWQGARSHPLIAVFLLSLVVRLSNLALLRGNNSFFAEPDAFTYWMLGTALAKVDGFWTTLSSMTDRMPLYPLVLAGIQSAFGSTPRTAAAAQAVLDAGTCTLIAALGTLVSPLTGLIAGMLAAVSVTLVVFSTQLLTDAVFLFFFTVMLLAGAHFLLRASMGAAALAGSAGGLALATRPWIAPLLIAATPLIFTVAIIRSRRVGVACVTAALFAAAAAAPIAPILLRNVTHYGSFSLTSQAGDHLAFWIVPLVKQRAYGTPYEISVQRMQALYEQRLAERSLEAQSNPFARASIKVELARQQLARLPLKAIVESWIEGMVVNLAAPALIADPRVRALPKPSFYETPGRNSLGESARLSVRACGALSGAARPRNRGHAAFPGSREPRLHHAGSQQALGSPRCRCPDRLFSAPQRTGREPEISAADRADADRVGRNPAGSLERSAHAHPVRCPEAAERNRGESGASVARLNHNGQAVPELLWRAALDHSAATRLVLI